MTDLHPTRSRPAAPAVLLALLLTTAAAADDGDVAFTQSVADNLRAAGDKLVALAEATDADKFSWQPTLEVRSISQVYVHVIGTNLHLPPGLGAAPPEGIEIPDSGPYALSVQRGAWEAEFVDKEDVVDMLRRSFDYAVAAVPTIEDLGAQVTPFGFRASKRDYLLILMAHANEHLGQSIAYARSAGIVPPWSRTAERDTPDSSAAFEGGAALGQVLEIDRFGNLETSFVGDDLDRLGLQTGDLLTLTVGDKTADALIGESFFDVQMGEWIAFLSQAGRLLVGRSYASAASTLDVEAGDSLSIRASGSSP